MADTSLFTRLQRLFSSDVIIRNVGGKQLKVMDADRIQKYGNLESNSLYDRFTRLHRPVGSSLQYNPTLNYSSMRLQLYSDYEAMDYDSLILFTQCNASFHRNVAASVKCPDYKRVLSVCIFLLLQCYGKLWHHGNVAKLSQWSSLTLGWVICLKQITGSRPSR